VEKGAKSAIYKIKNGNNGLKRLEEKAQSKRTNGEPVRPAAKEPLLTSGDRIKSDLTPPKKGTWRSAMRGRESGEKVVKPLQQKGNETNKFSKTRMNRRGEIPLKNRGGEKLSKRRPNQEKDRGPVCQTVRDSLEGRA